MRLSRAQRFGPGRPSPHFVWGGAVRASWMWSSLSRSMVGGIAASYRRSSFGSSNGKLIPAPASAFRAGHWAPAIWSDGWRSELWGGDDTTSTGLWRHLLPAALPPRAESSTGETASRAMSWYSGSWTILNSPPATTLLAGENPLAGSVPAGPAGSALTVEACLQRFATSNPPNGGVSLLKGEKMESRPDFIGGTRVS